jgi:glucoamylase
VLADPAASDTLDDDRGRGMVAWDASSASAVEADPALRDASAGYRGTPTDPWIDLQDQHLSGSVADTPGDVVQGALTALDGKHKQRMKLAIGFGRDTGSAVGTARASLRSRDAARQYASGWSSYLASLRRPPASVARDVRLYQQSLMVLAASEDKLNRGATVAAPNMPWVWGTLTLENPADGHSGPYHLVWPRDFYHVVTAQSAAGDSAAATRQLDYLWRIQKPDGSWWQNTEPDGDPHWTGLQMDEVALPVVLAWWLGRTGADDWAHIQKAADFIVANGPRTGQERWENQDGYSPNTIAAEIAGLVTAADVARKNGAGAKADAYLATADDWQRRVEAMTATTNGPLSPKPYYLRITKDANPNDGSTYDLGDNYSPNPIDERRVVDNSFLGLVLFGAKKWNDPTVLNSLAVGDRDLRVNTPNGPVWHRFSFDGYGETADGGDWNIFPTAANQTHGRLWPLLTGERGEYELLAGRRADAYLETMAKTANDGLMLPEQVFENTGEGTRSSTPLAWTHAQFIRLAWSIQAGAPIETPSIVADRYAR